MGERLDHINSEAVRQIAGSFGELTTASAAMLQPESSDPYFIADASRRAESLERLASAEAYLLCDAMYRLPGPASDLDHSQRISAIRRSHKVAQGYGLLSGAGESIEGGYDECSMLLALQEQPERWLTLLVGEQAFDFTAYGSHEVKRSYEPRRGCPAIGMHVIQRDQTRANLFIRYWEAVVQGIGDKFTDKQWIEAARQWALRYITGEERIPGNYR